MKSVFGLGKKTFILMSCIAVALVASGIVIGIAVSNDFTNKDEKNTVTSSDVSKNGADTGSPDKNGSVASADNSEVSVGSGESSGGVSLEDAKKIALADAGLSEADVSFSQTEQDTDDNIQVYDIKFSTSDKKYGYEINADDGSVIEKDVRALNTAQSSLPVGGGDGDKYISVGEAKETALKDAGLSASDVKFVKAELDNDNNVKVYDVEFTAADKKYDYEINAVDRSIIEKDIKILNISRSPGQSGNTNNGNTDNSGYIGLERAKEISLSDANVSASNATFTKTQLDNDDRTPRYDIEFCTSDKKYDYEINAINGNIIEKDVETTRAQQTAIPSGNTNNNNYIGVEKAKQIALSDANVSASNATFTKTQLDNDDRTSRYDIEFCTSDKKYDYEINAINGNIIEKDVETIRAQQTAIPSGNTNNNNYIGVEKAKQIALSDANVSSSSVTFTKTRLDSDDRIPKYDIEFCTSDKKYDYEINAINGNIIEKDIENIRTQQSSKPSNSNTNSNYIGVEKAKEIALSHAGLSGSDVRIKKAELDRDDGRYEYEIEFVSGRTEYEYTIDAVSGTILEHDSDYDD